MTREQWIENKKYKKQLLGINPEWVKRYIITPLTYMTIIVIILVVATKKYIAYAEEKAEREAEQLVLEESRRLEEEEKLKAEIQKQLKAEEEKKIQESIKQAEVEKRRTNTLYENKVSKEKCPIGTYLRNDKTKKVGRVVGYYGLEVITNNEWNFTLDGNGIYPKEIKEIGNVEYIKKLKAQKKREEEKQKKEDALRIQKILEEEIAKQTKETKAYYGNYNHIEYKGVKYRIIDIKGDELTILQKGQRKKKNNYKYLNAYAPEIKMIGWREYEIRRPE